MSAVRQSGHGPSLTAEDEQLTPTTPRRVAVSQVLALMSLIVPAVCIVIATQGSEVAAMQVLAAVSIIGGIGVFLRHGGRRVTGAGIYCLTAGLMCGASSYYWSVNVSTLSSRHGIFLAAISIFASTAVMYALFWDTSVPRIDTRSLRRPAPISAGQAQSAVLIGTILFMLGVVGGRVGVSFGTLNTAAADVGVTILVSALLLSGSARILGSPIRIVFIAAVFVGYYATVFTGNGRLRLAFLAITVAVIAQYRVRANIKLVGLVALLPIVSFFAFIGQNRVAANAEASANGLGSLVYPMSTIGQLIDGDVTIGHGRTLVAEAVILVPRQVWTGKPDQFGRVLALRLRPGAENTNLALPCMPQGEWYYNFGWLGLLPMIGLLGYLIRKMDQAFTKRNLKPLKSLTNFYGYVTLAIFIGSMSDLAWGGTPTWNNRNAQRMVVVLPILLVAYLASRRHSNSVGAADGVSAELEAR